MPEISNTFTIYALKKVTLLLSLLVAVSGVSFCSAAPEDTLLVGNTYPLTSLMQRIEARSFSPPLVARYFLSSLENLPEKSIALHSVGHLALQSVPTGFASGVSFQTLRAEVSFDLPSFVALSDFLSGLSLVSSNAFSLQLTHTVDRVITVVGSGMSLLGGVDPLGYVPHVLSGGTFKVSKFPSFLASNIILLPRIAEVGTLSQAGEKKGVVLGVNTSAASVKQKSTLPFLDRLSLSVYCAFASKDPEFNNKRCNYENVIQDDGNTSLESSLTTIPTSVTTDLSVLPVRSAPMSVLDMATSSFDLLVQALSSKISTQSIYITKYVTEYVPVPGRDGRDGRDGKDGSTGITTANTTQLPPGFGSYFVPNTSQTSLTGISTIGYLKDTTIDTPVVTGGTANNFSLTNSTSKNTVFNGFSVFNDSVDFTGSASVSNLSVASSTLIDSSITNALIGNSTTTNAFISTLSAGISSINSLSVFGALSAGGTTTLATTTATNLFANESIITNSTTTHFFTDNLVVGSSSILGNQVIFGAFDVVGTTTLGSDLFLKGNVTIGTSTSERLTINSLINSHIQPAQNKTYDLGSASFFWRTLYADSINVNSISAASTTISGTANNDFTINSDNNSNDTEDAQLLFFRGLVGPNAILRWNSVTDRMETNMSFKIQDETPSIGSTSLTVRAGVGQGLQNMFLLKDFNGNELSIFDSKGWLGIGTTTPTAMLSVQASSTALTSPFISFNSTTSPIFNVLGNGNVGIGTANPTSPLSVAGNIFGSGALQINGNSGFGTGSSPSTRVQISPSANVSALNITTASGQNSPLVTITSNGGTTGDYFTVGNTGNVGIGTTTPGSRLTVSSSTANGTASLFSVSTSSSILTVLANGNVGIGTTNPSRMLELSGVGTAASFRLSSTSGYADIYQNSGTQVAFNQTTLNGNALMDISPIASDGTSTQFIRLFRTSSSTGATNLQILRGDGTPTINSLLSGSGTSYLNALGGNVGIGTTTPVARLSVMGLGLTTGIGFQVANASNTPSFTVLDNGNAGIGTTTPIEKLSILSADNVPSTNIFAVRSNNLQQGVGIGYGTVRSLGSQANVDLTLDTQGVGALIFNTNASERARFSGSNFGVGTTSPVGRLSVTGAGLTTGIGLQVANASNTPSFTVLDNGNVGIGTTTPISPLTVLGAARIQSGDFALTLGADNGATTVTAGTTKSARVGSVASNGTVPIGMIFANNTAGANALSIGGGSSIMNAVTSLSFFTASNVATLTGTERFTIGSTGNIGVASTSPTGARFVIAGAGLTTGKTFTTTDASNTPTFTILDNGNIGIGIVAPSETLAVYRPNAGGYNQSWYRSDTGAGWQLGLAGGDFRLSRASGTGNLLLGVDNSGIAAGNVGIGTTTPGFLLTVAGDAYFAGNITLASTTATTTFNGNVSLGNGAFFYDASSTQTSISNLVAGNLSFDTDAGQVSWIDLPISATTATGTIMSYTSQLGGNNMFTVYGEHDGQGNIQNPRFGFGTTTPTSYFQITGTGTTPLLTVGTTTNQSVFNVSANGNIGIGTSSPTNPLTVVGSSSSLFSISNNSTLRTSLSSLGFQQWYLNDGTSEAGSLAYSTPGGTPGMVFFNTGGTGRSQIRQLLSTGGLAFGATTTGSNPGDTMVLTTAGNVGIGTTTPASTLSIDSGSGAAGIAVNTSASNFDAFNMLVNNASRFRISKIGTDTNFVTSGTTNLLFMPGGNVGIGTTTPAALLGVNGDAYIAGNLTATGTLAIGTSTLFTTSAGWVGIGVQSPAAIFNVNGSGSSNTDFRLSRIGAPTTYLSVSAPGGANTRSVFGLNNTSAFAIQANGSLGIGSGTGYTDGTVAYPANGLIVQGSVGIGTTSPSVPLEVSSNSSIVAMFGTSTPATQGISINNGRAQFGFNNSSSNTYVLATAGKGIEFSASSTGAGNGVAMVISSNGNVGIGTTTPVQKLSLIGNVMLADSVTGSGFFAQNVVGTHLFSTTRQDGVTTADMSLSAFGGIGFATNRTTGPASTTYNMYITPSGNVGIGTTTPSASLTVGGGAGGSFAVLASTGSEWFSVGTAGAGVVSFNTQGGSTLVGTNVVNQGARFNLTTGSTSTKGLSVYGVSGQTSNLFEVSSSSLAGGNYFVITGNGNVGIGTTTPIAPLSIASTSPTLITLDRSGGSNANIAFRASAQAITYAGIGAGGTGFGIGPISDLGNSPWMTITTAGNVGIGTTTPDRQLTISRNDAATATGASISLEQLGTGNSWMNFTIASSTAGMKSYALGMSNAGLFQIGYDTVTKNGISVNPRFTIDTAGNIGIGTTTPDFKLSIGVPNATNADDGMSVRRVAGGLEAVRYGLKSDASGQYRGAITAINAIGSAVEAISIAASQNIGNVGIGTTTPGAKLDVWGNLNVATGSSPVLFVNTAIGTNGRVGIGTSTLNSKLVVQGGTSDSAMSALNIFNSIGSSLFFVRNDGKIGIGTTSPDSSLTIIPPGSTALTKGQIRLVSPSGNVQIGDVIGGVDFISNDLNNYTETAFIRAISSGNHVVGSTATDLAFTVTANGTSTPKETVRFTGSGDVGIGTTTPVAKLDVWGNLNVGTSSIPALLVNTATGRTILGSTGSSFQKLFVNGDIGTDSVLYTNQIRPYSGSNISVLNANFGIGTTSPTAGFVVGNAITNTQLVGAQVSPNMNFSIVFGNSGTALLVEPTFSNNVSGLDVLDFYGVRINNSASSAIQAVNMWGLYVDSATGATNNFGAYIGGAVGIGTSTPKSQLDVWSATSTSNVDLFRLASAVGGANNIKFRVDSDGDIFTDGATTVGTPADIAESYSAIEAVDAGTVVAFGTSTTAWSATYGSATSTASSSDVYEISGVRKAVDGYEAVGVVSTRPGLHLGADIIHGVPVALSGRVPVKVTNENGEIKRGDYLTVSTTRPGYAMKLTGEGRSIGRVLSDQVSGNDKVMVYIESGYQKLDMAGKTATTTGMLTTGNVDLNANGVAILNIKSLASANGTWSISEDGRIVAKVLCLDDVCIDKNQLTNILNSTGQSGAVAGTSTQSSLPTDTVAGTATTTDSTVTSIESANSTSGTDITPVTAPSAAPAIDSSTPADSASATADIPITEATAATSEPSPTASDTTTVSAGDSSPVI